MYHCWLFVTSSKTVIRSTGVPVSFLLFLFCFDFCFLQGKFLPRIKVNSEVYFIFLTGNVSSELKMQLSKDKV